MYDTCSQHIYNKKISKSLSIVNQNFNVENHILFGQYFETSILYCAVSNCDCCKRIRVNHDNNLFEKIYCNVVKRTRLCGINHDSLKYCCADICNGETIYCTKRPTQISYYTTHHAEKVYGIFTLIKKNLMLLYVIFDTTMYLMRIVSIYY